ncbi:MAG: hypothetical protein HY999_02700 [Nitrospinae bacterium]|nr:hypothetical protein [Nitrospinota bacterium]
MVNGLRVIGGVTIALGVIVGLGMLIKFSEAEMFSKAGLTPIEFGIAVGMVFYHVIFGILCLGIAEVLELLGTSSRNINHIIQNTPVPEDIPVDMSSQKIPEDIWAK